MAESGRKRRRGGNLSRTETVTVRLDPKLRYFAGLAARRQRRTLSSFIEWAIEDSLKRVILFDDGHDTRNSVADEVLTLWRIEEADRFVELAFKYPDLLTYDEQLLWELIKENRHVWDREVIPEKIVLFELRKRWESFKAIARGEKDRACLSY